MRGYLSLGSNLGDRLENLKSSLDELSLLGVRTIRTSRVYETKPVEVIGQQKNYLNMVAAVEFDIAPSALLKVCQSVEESLGRKRTYPHAPRTIDIDILLLEHSTVSTKKLVVPHPRMENRAFVIFPLADIAPHIVLPSGRDIIDVKNALSDDEILKVWKIKDE